MKVYPEIAPAGDKAQLYFIYFLSLRLAEGHRTSLSFEPHIIHGTKVHAKVEK